MGVIYVDGVSIPNSDIFVLFPYLFKAKRQKNLIGFDDFIQKISDMGLLHLVYKKEVKYHVQQNERNLDESLRKVIKKDQSDINWWFLD